MAGKRDVHLASLKAQVALAAHQGKRSVHELAEHFGVHRTLIHAWKRDLITGAEQIFDGKANQQTDAVDAHLERLLAQIERLEMELAWIKKKLPPSCKLKRSLVERGHPCISVRRQCELIGLNRSSLYLAPAAESPEDRRLMRLIGERHMAYPFHGSRRITDWLNQQGHVVNRKRVQRLMRLMGLEAISRKRPRTTAPANDAWACPNRLRQVNVDGSDRIGNAETIEMPIDSASSRMKGNDRPSPEISGRLTAVDCV